MAVKFTKARQICEAGDDNFVFELVGDDNKKYIGIIPPNQGFAFMQTSGYLTALNAGIAAAVVAQYEAALPAFDLQDTANPNAIRVPMMINYSRINHFSPANAPAAGIVFSNGFLPSIGFSVTQTDTNTGLLGTTTQIIPVPQTQQIVLEKPEKSLGGGFDIRASFSSFLSDPFSYLQSNPLESLAYLAGAYVIIQKLRGQKKVLGFI